MFSNILSSHLYLKHLRYQTHMPIPRDLSRPATRLDTSHLQETEIEDYKAALGLFWITPSPSVSVKQMHDWIAAFENFPLKQTVQLLANLLKKYSTRELEFFHHPMADEHKMNLHMYSFFLFHNQYLKTFHFDVTKTIAKLSKAAEIFIHVTKTQAPPL